MTKVNNLLTKRLNSKKNSSKMTALAQKSAQGNLSSFTGLFGVNDLNEEEKEKLENLLTKHSSDKEEIAKDLADLISITCEVKAINNQAALLHGERIQKAQQLLAKYRDGAFTDWLLTTYGNRQTPYNFLQYFDFWNRVTPTLRPQIESMPRQAIYSLASREGSLKKKEEIIHNFSGETKNELMILIRESFPLAKKDRRAPIPLQACVKRLCEIKEILRKNSNSLKSSEWKILHRHIDEILQIEKNHS